MDKIKKEQVSRFGVSLGKDLLDHNPPGGATNALREHVVKMRRAAGLLLHAWSPMAVRNLLADMQRALVHIHADPRIQANLGWSNACARLRGFVGSELGTQGPSRCRYAQVLCLGYRVKTTADRYTGQVDDVSDLRARCEDMKRAVRAAYALADSTGNYNADPQVLKVFMAPEFYFRGRHGAYEHAVVHGIEKPRSVLGRIGNYRNPVEQKGLMEIMNEELDRDIYRDWLFVLGTVICATKITDWVCATCNGNVEFPPVGGWGRDRNKTRPRCVADHAHPVREVTRGAMVDNVAFVKKEKEYYTVSKELVSHMDYHKDVRDVDPLKHVKNEVTVRGEDLQVLRTPQPSGFTSADSTPSKFRDERMGGSVFTIDGVTFGLEVCLDHAASVGSDSKGRLGHAGNIQVQLIPSGGMGVTFLRAVKDGVVFNVDGVTPHVQVVGPGATPEMRNDIEGRTQRGITNLPRSDGPVNFDDANLTNWNRVVNAPKVTVGARGSVLLYGPYNLSRL